MTNRYQIYAHKNETKMMEREAKMEPGMEPQIKQRREKTILQNDPKTERYKCTWIWNGGTQYRRRGAISPGGPGEARGKYINRYII